ncbi:MAG TPA: flagellar hook-associated protein FlgK [Jatrophihabitans sp.]|jgi:flagellar hook-associated protein 1 FlgK|uniref:flagellar hook-associated protein FlgK n=1 Tax=Jatrophihabitans sp. TaxID=1932789 RepID=UPI002EF8E4A6
MSSSFSGLTNALAALNVQRYGMEVTGQNIANANTAGYTRQRAELAAVGPATGVSALYATQSPHGSVTVSGTTRLNDPMIDARARAEHGDNGYLQTTTTVLSSAEALFDEPSDHGLAEQLNDFWNSWAAVANNPGDLAARNVVLQKAAGLASTLNQSSAALDRLTQSVSQQATAATVKINTAATALAQLNGDIAVATASGANVNTLADQRDSLLMTLADLTGAQTSIGANGAATVTVGGQSLVSGVTASAVSLSGNQILVGGVPAGPAGGSLQGLVDGLSTALPGYAAQLDAVAAALASTVNADQASGYDLAGNPGGPLFAGSTAATLSVVVTNPAKLAASGSPGGNLDGSKALSMSQLGSSNAGADAAYRTLVGTLATDVQRATQQATVQQAVTNSVDALAQSSSGVSFDEETTNLLTYQRAYQAASRVLTTVDEMLDTLISHTGRVGL